LVTPADIFQLVLPQKDIFQMKDTYVFLQKGRTSHPSSPASKAETEKVFILLSAVVVAA
jgi:hypothetical protein